MVQNTSQTLVMKFGGTSVGTTQAFKQVSAIIQDALREWGRLVVVTSALSGVTNLLLECATQAAKGDLETLNTTKTILEERHLQIAHDLIEDPERLEMVKQSINQLIATFQNLCSAISILGEASPRALDAVASLGERMCIQLLAAACSETGIPAQAVESTNLIITNANFQNAHPDYEATTNMVRATLEPLLSAGVIPVVSGFIGSTSEGVITTLGRGGSDYTASILGAVLHADDIWIWTDVDGVMTADPQLVPDARTIPEVSYEEIAELAYFGAKVLHPKAVRPVVDAGIGLRICNSFNPANPGTRLVLNQKTGNNPDGKKVIKAVTAIRSQRLVTIEGRGMLGVPGVAARAFAAVASTGTSVPLITQSSSEQSICFAIPGETSETILKALQKTFALELLNRDIDRVWSSKDVSIITIVGTGTNTTPGVAGSIFQTLGQAGINILAIAQGSSAVSISLVVESKNDQQAVRALNDLIIV